MSIVAIVLAKNEEKNIEKCVESVGWCDEVIVIDDESTDTTVNLVEGKAKVLHHVLEGDFARQRNWAMEQMRLKKNDSGQTSMTAPDWILFVDADEVVSEELAQEIQNVIRKNTDSGQAGKITQNFVAYRMKRDDWMISKFLHYGESAEWNQIRLVTLHNGIWEGKVHERFITQGKVGQLENHLQHFPHETMSDFLKSVNVYSSLRAQELHAHGVKAGMFSIIFYPLAKFIQNYIVYSGWRDGSHGMVHAIVMSLHSFLVRGKLYLLGRT